MDLTRVRHIEHEPDLASDQQGEEVESKGMPPQREELAGQPQDALLELSVCIQWPGRVAVTRKVTNARARFQGVGGSTSTASNIMLWLSIKKSSQQASRSLLLCERGRHIGL